MNKVMMEGTNKLCSQRKSTCTLSGGKSKLFIIGGFAGQTLKLKCKPFGES